MQRRDRPKTLILFLRCLWNHFNGGSCRSPSSIQPLEKRAWCSGCFTWRGGNHWWSESQWWLLSMPNFREKGAIVFLWCVIFSLCCFLVGISFNSCGTCLWWRPSAVQVHRFVDLSVWRASLIHACKVFDFILHLPVHRFLVVPH